MSSTSTNSINDSKRESQEVFSKECPTLLTHHFEQLHKGSAISIDVIKERGYESVLGKKRLAELGFSKTQQLRIPGLLCPGWNVRGANNPLLFALDTNTITQEFSRDNQAQLLPQLIDQCIALGKTAQEIKRQFSGNGHRPEAAAELIEQLTKDKQ